MWLPVRHSRSILQPTASRSFSSSRYNSDSISRSEFIYGTGFHAPGGKRSMDAFATGLEGLSAGNRVVELGCGLGGPANYLASTYGVRVTGVDIAPAMIAECEARQEDPSVDFICGSMTDASLFEPSSVDMVWSRDAILYIEPDLKRQVADAIAKWLKPNGQFMIGDFGCCSTSTQPLSEGFLEYSTGMHLIELGEYKEILEENAKLAVASVEDLTEVFIRFNKQDLESFLQRREEFEARFPGPYFEELVARWRLKIAIAEDGSFVYQRIVGHRR